MPNSKSVYGRLLLSRFGSHLGRDGAGFIFGAYPGKVIVNGQPRYLAFDAHMFVRRPVLWMIQAAGAHGALVVHMNIADHQVGSANRAGAVLSPIGGAVELGFALGNPECFAPKKVIRIE